MLGVVGVELQQVFLLNVKNVGYLCIIGNDYFLSINLVSGYWWNSQKVLQFVKILGIVGIAIMFFCGECWVCWCDITRILQFVENGGYWYGIFATRVLTFG
jgi:hypothetical protein